MRFSLTAILAIAVGSLASPAHAVDGATPDARPVTVDSTDVAAPGAVDAASPFAAPVASDALDALRGGTDTTTTITNVSDVDGTVDGNTAVNTLSAGNVVDGGAFGNAAGLSTVIQNSGNNVLIQNSTVVSVQFAPTP